MDGTTGHGLARAERPGTAPGKRLPTFNFTTLQIPVMDLPESARAWSARPRGRAKEANKKMN